MNSNLPLISHGYLRHHHVIEQKQEPNVSTACGINNRIAGLNRIINAGDGKPIGAAYTIFKEVTAELKVETDRLQQVLAKDLPAFNAEAKRAGVDPIK